MQPLEEDEEEVMRATRSGSVDITKVLLAIKAGQVEEAGRLYFEALQLESFGEGRAEMLRPAAMRLVSTAAELRRHGGFRTLQGVAVDHVYRMRMDAALQDEGEALEYEQVSRGGDGGGGGGGWGGGRRRW